MLILPGRQQDAPRAPAEIAEAVELYARDHGRTGSVEFAVGPNVWLVKLSLRPNDKRMQLWREGQIPEPLTEVVPLVDVHGKPLDLYQMGAAGVRTYLERGNTWSGRGEFKSVEDAVRQSRERDEAERVRHRARMKEENRYERREDRRRYMEIPAVTVGIDLRNPEPEA